MRSIAAIFLSTTVLLVPVLALAEGGGVVKPSAVGTANPAPPTSGAEVVPPPIDQSAAPGADNTALGSSRDAPKPSATSGIDNSTAGPGGQAESTKNGALSSPTPADSSKTAKHPKKSTTGVSPDADTKS